MAIGVASRDASGDGGGAGDGRVRVRAAATVFGTRRRGGDDERVGCRESGVETLGRGTFVEISSGGSRQARWTTEILFKAAREVSPSPWPGGTWPTSAGVAGFSISCEMRRVDPPTRET